jgi:hypothetical protein
MDNITKIQELTRIMDATLASVNPSGLSTGQNAMEIIKFISQFPGMNNYVDVDFSDLMDTEIKKSTGKNNVREHVKKIWMYPKYAYDPWSLLELDSKILSDIHQKLSDIKFKFKITDGKVYLCPVNGESFSDMVYNQTKPYLENDIIPNIESSHVTVINSNIVYDCEINNVVQFIENYSDEFSLEFDKIKSTTSNDWSVFSKCYVIEVKSDYLTNFISNFNQQFGKSIKPSPHITFAIKPRKMILFN